jgi:hypothetical protein
MKALSSNNRVSRRLKAAALLACALLLTGCLNVPSGSEEPDYSVLYSDYISYSFGADAAVTKGNRHYGPDGTRMQDWSAQYTSKNGEKREFSFSTCAFEPGFTSIYASAQHYYDYEMLRACFEEASRNAGKELAAEIFSKYFALSADAPSVTVEPERNVSAWCDQQFAPLVTKPECAPLAEKAADPQTGFQLCNADMFSMAKDVNVLTVFQITIQQYDSRSYPKTEQEPYIDIMEKMYADYMRLTDAPQNYLFLVEYRHWDKNHNYSQKPLYQKAALTEIGEFDITERYGYDADYWRSMLEDLAEILLQHTGKNGNT